MKLSILIFAAAVLCSTVLKADTGTLYTNFEADLSYNDTSGLTVTDDGVAIPFTVPSVIHDGFEWALTSIEFAAYSTESGQPVTVGIWDTFNGVPGTELESFTPQIIAFDDSLDPSAYLVTVDSELNPLLASGQEYWISLSNSSGAVWGANSTNQFGVSSNSGGTWGPLSISQGQGAVEILGTEVLPASEPGTLLGLGSGLAVIVFSRRRAKRQNPTHLAGLPPAGSASY